MVRHLHGIVLDSSPTQVVVDVRGIGYAVAVTNGLSFTVGDVVQLWTHLAVRENALDLYGFPTRDELDVFEILLTLPKVGPKSALQILTQADVALLKQAVAEQDASHLTKVSGIGKKTAEKIVVELKDKFADVLTADAHVGESDAVTTPGTSSPHSDVIDALLALGYSPHDAREAAKTVPNDISDTSEAVRSALRGLGSA